MGEGSFKVSVKMHPESAERVNAWASALSGPPVTRGSSWQPTVAFNLESPVVLRRIISPNEFGAAKDLMSRGLTTSQFAPRVGTQGTSATPPLPLRSLPGQTAVGVNIGIGVGLGQAVAGMVIYSEDVKAQVLTAGFAESKEAEDAGFFGAICGAMQLSMDAVGTRVRPRTMKRKKNAEDRVRIHGWSRRRSK